MNRSRPIAQALLACLGEESRFRLVQALIGGARCVTDLAAEVGLSQSCTTRHLQSLERRRLVSGTRDGKRVFYRIREDDPGLLPLLGWALAEAKGAAAVGARRSESATKRSPDPATLGPGSGATLGPGSGATLGHGSGATLGAGSGPASNPLAWKGRAQAGGDQVPARPTSPREDLAGAPDPRHKTRPSAAPEAFRRVRGSDIEDYLL